MTYKLSKNSIKNMDGVHPDLIMVCEVALGISMIDFGIPSTGGLRTAAVQNKLYMDGKSKADGFETLSNHQAKEDGYSHALDFYGYVDGKASWEEQHLAMIAAAFLQAASNLSIAVEWGGFWRGKQSKLYGWDMPHMQLVD